MSERWQPVPIPQGDGRHDIGDDMRAAIVKRLIDDWSHDPDLSAEKVRQLAMWAGASVRSLFHELGALRDMGDAAAPAVQDESIRVHHARMQGGADGFQQGWHAALQRVQEGDAAADLKELCPSPAVAQAPATARLLELAWDTSWRNHERCADETGTGCRDGHEGPHRTCPHSDCVLVRALAAPSVQQPDCICRTASCGHRASQHVGPNGACVVCERECWS